MTPDEIRSRALEVCGDIPEQAAQYLQHETRNKAGGIVMLCDLVRAHRDVTHDDINAIRASAARLIEIVDELTEPALTCYGTRRAPTDAELEEIEAIAGNRGDGIPE